MEILLTAFITGIVGSLHCVGMCGPIALGLPGKGQPSLRFLWGRILYNSGRIITYSLLGGLVALLGAGARMFQLQQAFSITLGILLLIWAVKELGIWRYQIRWKLGSMFTQAVRSGFKRWFGKGTPKALFMIGLMNGLLPCGFVYLALFYAAAFATEPWMGMGVMAMFGLGTFPVMFALSFSGKWITPGMRSWVNRVVPYSIAFFGLLFILRGMALGIPFISPKMEMNPEGEVKMSCCSKKEMAKLQEEVVRLDSLGK